MLEMRPRILFEQKEIVWPQPTHVLVEPKHREKTKKINTLKMRNYKFSLTGYAT